jgi:mannan polymerase II complex MNN10 subunit
MYSEYAARLRSRESFKKEVGFRHYWSTVQTLSRAFLVLIFITAVLSALGFFGSSHLLRKANDLGRRCSPRRGNAPEQFQRFKFAMVTCSDGSSTIPGRSFEGVMEMVAPNKKAYVKRHGYDFIDASSLLDTTRPPSWSKILAVKEQLSHYDWVFWNDAVSSPTCRLLRRIARNFSSDDHLPTCFAAALLQILGRFFNCFHSLSGVSTEGRGH